VPAQTPQRFGFGKSVVFGFGIAACVLAAAEGGRRLAGYASPASDPYEAFVSKRPLFERHDGIHRTHASRASFFHAQSFPASKHPATFRFFAFGGSTVYGYGLSDPARESFVALLAERLAARDPPRRVEGINGGGISYASYRLVGLVEEALAYEPDLLVVATGHNEFLEARHYADWMKGVAWWRQILHELRLAQVVRDGLTAARASPAVAAVGAGEPALQAEYVGERYIVRDAREYALTLSHFARNVERIVDAARVRGVPVVVVTLPANLRDWPPFPTVTASEAERADLERRLNRAAAHLKGRRYRAALADARAVLAEHEHAAVFHYLAARSLDALGDRAEARRHYVLAKNTDGFPHRALTAFNDRLRQIAAARGATLVDGEAVFAAAARDGIPGDDLFVDHCHPNPAGHRLLAEAIAEQLSARAD